MSPYREEGREREGVVEQTGDSRQETEGGWTSITTSAALNTDPDVEVEP